MTDDAELLRQFARAGSEIAFEELVGRYLPLVYSTALRILGGDEALAKDVAQTVFIDLAKKANSLEKRELLTGWLYSSARLAALTTLRGERRRQLREQAAAAMQDTTLSPSPDPDHAELRRVLDEAMGELGHEDRNALLLRFFRAKELKDVGAALGISEDAARMRINRSLQKLHALLSRRGVALPAAALGTALAAETAVAMPAGLAASIAGTALAESATTVATLTAKTIAMTTMQKAIAAAAITAISGIAFYQTHQASHLRGDVEAFRRSQAPLTEQIRQLKQERDDAASRLASLTDEVARLRNSSAELPGLRAELSRLRAQSQELARLQAESPGTGAEAVENAWLERAKLLQERIGQTQDAAIPELQFLTQWEWLMAAKHKLNTDEDYLQAFADARTRAIGKFADKMRSALQKYLQANNNQFPTGLAQLKSSFETPPDDDLLERYQIVPRASVPMASLDGNPEGWVITLKSPQDENNWAVGADSSVSAFVDNPQMTTLAPAIKAAFDAAQTINGRKQFNIHQVAPYLTTPEQKAAYEELLQGSK